MYWKSLLDYVDFVLNERPFNVPNGGKHASSLYSVLTSKSMANAAALWKDVVRPGAHGHLFRPVLQLCQRCNMLWRERDEEKTDISDGKSNATRYSE